MALVQKRAHIGEHYYKHTYSDDGHFIIQTDTGLIFQEALDPIGNPNEHTYEESEELIPVDEPEEELSQVDLSDYDVDDLMIEDMYAEIVGDE